MGIIKEFYIKEQELKNELKGEALELIENLLKSDADGVRTFVSKVIGLICNVNGTPKEIMFEKCSVPVEELTKDQKKIIFLLMNYDSVLKAKVFYEPRFLKVRELASRIGLSVSDDSLTADDYIYRILKITNLGSTNKAELDEILKDDPMLYLVKRCVGTEPYLTESLERDIKDVYDKLIVTEDELEYGDKKLFSSKSMLEIKNHQQEMRETEAMSYYF